MQLIPVLCPCGEHHILFPESCMIPCVLCWAVVTCFHGFCSTLEQQHSHTSHTFGGSSCPVLCLPWPWCPWIHSISHSPLLLDAAGVLGVPRLDWGHPKPSVGSPGGVTARTRIRDGEEPWDVEPNLTLSDKTLQSFVPFPSPALANTGLQGRTGGGGGIFVLGACRNVTVLMGLSPVKYNGKGSPVCSGFLVLLQLFLVYRSTKI